MTKNTFPGAAVAALLSLSACGSATPQASNTTSATKSAAAPTGVGAPTNASRAGFDPARIRALDLGTGGKIVDGFGISCPFAANAQGRPDVVGVALGMGLQDAVSVLACRQAEATFDVNTGFHDTPYVALNGSTYGLKVAYQRIGEIDAEALDVALAGPRGQERVVGVWRAVYPAPGNAPTVENVLNQMNAKYGGLDFLEERSVYVLVKAADGTRLSRGSPQYGTCLQAVNYNRLTFGDRGSIERAAQAGCGDMVLLATGSTTNSAIAALYTILMLNPSYGEPLYAASGTQAREAAEAQRDRETEQASGRRPNL